jgi:hypothetical protein
VMAGFGAVISGVGASIMVGGNIEGYSRALTTATVMETSRGNFDTAIALSIILLLLSTPAAGSPSSKMCNASCEKRRLRPFLSHTPSWKHFDSQIESVSWTSAGSVKSAQPKT